MDSRCGDSLGIIYVNSARTFNALASQGEGAAINKEYQGIEVVRELDKLEYAHLKVAQPILDCPATHCADYVDALVVAVDLIIKLTRERVYSKRAIILATDLSSPFPIIETGMNEIAGRLTLAKITIEVLYAETFNSNEHNALVLEHLLQHIKGSQIRRIKSEIPSASLGGKCVCQTTSFNGELSLAGGALRIPIVSYVNTMPSQPLTPNYLLWDERSQREQGRLKRFSLYAPTIERGKRRQGMISGSATRTTTPDDECVGERKDLAKTYRYGKTLVQPTVADEAKMTLKCEKDFSIIGFLKQHQLPQHLLMSNTHLVRSPPDTAIQFGITLKALIRTCRQRSVAILARQVLRDGASTRLFALLPRKSHDDDDNEGHAQDCFVMARLPFLEDVRQHAALNLDVNSLSPRLRPSEEQLDVMRNWVGSMALPVDTIDPYHLPNPVLQRQVQCIIHRLASVDDPTVHYPPSTAEYNSLLRSLAIPEVMLTKSNGLLEHVRVAFPLKSGPEEVTKVIQLRDVPSRSSPQPKTIMDQTFSLVTRKELTCGEYSRPPEIRRLRRETLLSDFNSMVINPYYDLVVPAMLQLLSFIPELGTTNVDLALKAIQCLRIAAIREDEYKLLNAFLCYMNFTQVW